MECHGKPKVSLTFAVYRGDHLQRRDTISEDVVKIGRGPRSHLRIDDELVSRMHAVIEIDSEADLTLIDLGNQPGTRVNGESVSKCKVRPGDRIEVGSTLVVLESARLTTDATASRATASGIEPCPREEDGGLTYSMVKSGPEIGADEVESHLSAIEVIVLWGSTVVHVSHLTPPRAFCVGEELGCDCFLPAETLGTTRAPLVELEGQRPFLVIWPQATGYVDAPGQGRFTLEELVSSGRAQRSSEMSGAYEYELPARAEAHLELEAFVFRVAIVNAAKRAPPGSWAITDPETILYTGLSFLLHLGMVAAFAFFMPGMQGDDGEALGRDQILTMQKLLNAAAEREQAERDPPDVAETQSAREGGTGTSAKGESGALGNPTTAATMHKYGVEGPKDNPDPHLAKTAALDDAARFGAIGLLSTMAGGDPNAPTAPWGREESLGRDAKSAIGNLFGDAIDNAHGSGGLGLTGQGEGGGGDGQGIGLGDFGGLDHGAGPVAGQGIGVGHDRPGRGHTVRAPVVRELAVSINGRLPPEVIQRIVRQNFGRFRYCYEKGLLGDPALQGRVAVKFMIDRSGAVALSVDGGSDLPDQSVVRCVVAGFGNLSFPPPEGGTVTVVYPIVFNPGR